MTPQILLLLCLLAVALALFWWDDGVPVIVPPTHPIGATATGVA